MPVTSIFNTRNAAGDIIAQRFVYDDGKELENFYDGGVLTRSLLSDLSDVESWASLERTFDAAGNLVSSTVAPDSGDTVTDLFDAAGNRLSRTLTDTDGSAPWQTLETTFDAGGALLTREMTLDTGRIILESFSGGVRTSTRLTDAEDAEGWDVIETFFDAAGTVTRKVIVQDGGLEIDTEFSGGVVSSRTVTDPSAGQPGGSKNVQVRSEYDAAGTLLRTITELVDGNRLTSEFSGGRLTSRLIEDIDDDSPWTSINTLFNAAGQKTQVEIIRDNGSVTVDRLINTDPVAPDLTVADPRVNEDDTVTDTIPPILFVDADGDAVTLQSFDTTGLQGILTDLGGGTYRYDPDGQFESLAVGETTTTSFTYTVVDSYDGPLTPTATSGFGATDTGTVTLVIEGRNDDPVAVDDTATVTERTNIELSDGFNVRANDTDIDASDTLEVVSVDGSGAQGIFGLTTSGTFGNGTVEYSPNGAFTYLAVGETATDSFTYTISDGNGGTDTATVTVTITGVNDDPEAVADFFVIDANSAAETVNLLVNDTDPDVSDTLTITSVDPSTASGTVIDNGNGTITYDPNGQFDSLAAGEFRLDEFSYTISDGNGGTATGSVAFQVFGVNEDPVANDDVLSSFITEDSTVSVFGSFLLNNDSDPDLDTLEITGVDATSAQGVPLSTLSNGDISYTPDAVDALDALAQGETLDDSFTYTISDGNGGTDMATVSLTITGVNDAASIAGDTTGTVTEDVLQFATGTLTVTDPDTGEAGTQVQGSTAATNGYGVYSVDAAGNWFYGLFTSAAIQSLPGGTSFTDTFTVTSIDGTATETVTITVNGTNDAASIAGDTSGTVTEDGTLQATGTLTVTDVDTGESFAAPETSQSTTYGSYSVDANGDWTYDLDNANTDVQALDAGETLTDTFAVVSQDGSASETVTITIEGSAEGIPFSLDFEDVTGASGSNTVPLDGTYRGFTFSSGSGATLGEPTVFEADDPAFTNWNGLTGRMGFTSFSRDPLVIAEVDGDDFFFDSIDLAADVGDGGTVTITGFNDGVPVGTQTATITDTGLTTIDAEFSGLIDTLQISGYPGDVAFDNISLIRPDSVNAATISGDLTGTVSEDGVLTATGVLTVADGDAGENFIEPDSFSNPEGTFSINAFNEWTFTLNNSNPAIQALETGQSINVGLGYGSADGSVAGFVTITINGLDEGSTQTTVDFESTSIGVLPTNFEGFDWVVSAAFPSLIVQENLDNTTWDNLQTKTALTSGEASAVTVTQENGDNFEFVSIDLQGSDDAASTVTLLGFVDGAQTESQTFTLSNTTMNTFTPTGWSDIDELRIEGYQTTPGGVPQGDIAIDNFIFA